MKTFSSSLLAATAALALALPASLLAQSSCALASQWQPRVTPKVPHLPIIHRLPDPRPVTHPSTE